MRRIAAPTILAACTATLLLATMAVVVLHRPGNLAWDDADYLRRGLRIANRASDSTFPPLAAVRDLLRERPKPPLLVAWISLCASMTGRRSIEPLIVAASVGPFALLLICCGWLARKPPVREEIPQESSKSAGSASSTPLLAVLAIAASPLCVSLGAKVMVETTLGLTILLTLHCAAMVLQRPTTGRSFALGVSIGLAMLTKLTVALLLPGPAFVFGWIYLRRYGVDRNPVKILSATTVGILLVAGPWYVENGRAAVEFARFSSRYNIEAEGRTDRVRTPDRLISIGSQVIGWPNLVILGLVAASFVRLPGRRTHPLPNGAGLDGRFADFSLLASAGLASGGVGLLLPAYFDPRFLSPAWPAFAVALAGWVTTRFPPRLRGIAIGLLGIGAILSLSKLHHEPQTMTYWAARSLIDEVVAKHGAKTIGNVGDTGDWNVCKTGMMNELRPHPSEVFVLHDLSRTAPEALPARLTKLDAIVVLKDSEALSDIGQVAPGLNRARSAIDAAIERSGRFRRVESIGTASLPALDVYVRK